MYHPPTRSRDLPLKRVTIYNNNLALHERAGELHENLHDKALTLTPHEEAQACHQEKNDAKKDDELTKEKQTFSLRVPHPRLNLVDAV